MKYMKLGTNPDTFYTEEATRSVLSDVPIDLIIQINNTRYLLHKFPLLLKCGLLQRLCSVTDDDSDQPTPITLHDIPGGDEAFELCAKFCYGITIKLSAHNFMPAIAAAQFLRMTESVSRGNLVVKLETFFETCIVHGWKDSIATLQSVGKLPGWADDPRIVHRCMDAVIEKILTHPSKVTWSYTYTRPGYNQKQHRSVPKDWWTEDVSDLDLDIFRSIISTVRSTRKLPPALIGEALHVYACKHLPDATSGHWPAESSATQTDQSLTKHRRVLESIVSMIPTEPASVSGRFLLRLLKVANYVGASPSVRAELVRRSGRQLDEAVPEDLVFPLPSNSRSYDVGQVEAILESFLDQFRRRSHQVESERKAGSMKRVAKIFDSYLQVIASDIDLPVTKFIELVESLPGIARQEHDNLYRAIDTYLKEHSELSKAERKRLSQLIDCRRLSPDTRSHAIANDRLPLRTIVQLLFIEQGMAGGGAGGSRGTTAVLDPASVEASAPASDVRAPQRLKEQEHVRRSEEPSEAAWDESAGMEWVGRSRSGSKVTKNEKGKARPTR